MLIIAHRGGSGSRTENENSWSAFLHAQDLNTQAIETDLRRCPLCGRLVLSHDPLQNESEHARHVLFEDFLQFGEWAELHVEIKERGIVADALKATNGLLHKDAVVFSSFLFRELVRLRRLDGRARIGVLFGRLAWYRMIYIFCKMVGAESVHINFRTIAGDATRGKNIVCYFRRGGLRVYLYTVNSEEDILQARFMGADGIFTDYPREASNFLEQLIIQ